MSDGFLEKLRVPAGKSIDLKRRKPRETFGWDKLTAQQEFASLMGRANELQTRLYAESSQSLLVVLQAMDAAGKDGTIRTVFTGLNPAGVRVTSFKVPAGREAKQDYLWRAHAACPAYGEIGVFNRSHYEDVLAVRVLGLVPEERWRRRYRHIREFERLLTEEGTTIVKIYLDVSEDEQLARFKDRLEDPMERWKFRKADLDDRKHWPEYRKAFEDVFAETGTEYAPWFVVPADRKWVRNLCVAKVLVDALERMAPNWPKPEDGLDGIVIE